MQANHSMMKRLHQSFSKTIKLEEDYKSMIIALLIIFGGLILSGSGPSFKFIFKSMKIIYCFLIIIVIKNKELLLLLLFQINNDLKSLDSFKTLESFRMKLNFKGN
jgi:hypothetical protein